MSTVQRWTSVSYNFFKIVLSRIPNLQNLDCIMNVIVQDYPDVNNFANEFIKQH